MGYENKHLGYVYLVDENCKIRWAGCGFAIDDQERLALFDCTRALLERAGEKLDVDVDVGRAGPVGRKVEKMGRK